MKTAVTELLTPGKGILAADESLPSIEKRFKPLQIPNTEGLAEVAEATRRCFLRTVPAAVPGIVFLSGGRSEVAATERLNAICAAGELPWTLTFSYGRALQATALNTWKGAAENVRAAQAALHHRARCNGLALRGKYSKETEGAAAAG